MSGYLAKTFCCNAYCPRAKDTLITPGMTNRQMVALLTISKSEALQDDSGNYWCEQCKERYDLMNWGHLHNWPALNCFPYAVAQGQQSWELAVKMGIDAYVQALTDAIKVAEEI